MRFSKTILFILFFSEPSKGQIQPTVESSAGSEGNGSKRRRLLVLQTHARKRATSNPFDGDVNCEKTIMIGNLTQLLEHVKRNISLAPKIVYLPNTATFYFAGLRLLAI